MVRLTSLRVFIPCIAWAVALTALAASTNIDVHTSKITATFKQEGVPVDARFLKFSGNIVYDPNNTNASSAALDVDTSSLDLGDSAYNAEVRKQEWFDSSRFPTASFRSTVIKPVATGKFNATGSLTVKGKVLTITVPVSVQTVNGGAVFDGSVVLSRKAFGIGSRDWEDVLDDQVTLRFHLVSTVR